MLGKLTVVTLQGIQQTGALMERLTKQYYTDIAAYADLSLKDFFNTVKRQKYIADPKKIEFVQRPKFSLNPLAKFRDCDDKAVEIGSYLYWHGVPLRYLAVSNRPDGKIHHVLVQAEINGARKIIDATYPQNKLFHFKPITKAVPVSNWLRRM